MSRSEVEDQIDQIAIIGMACRFPNARNIDEFWRNLRDGVESVSFFTEQELLAAGIDPTILRDPQHIRAGSVLEDIDLFDASFFDFSPRQAELTDPQHRLFLECVWEALESAGYDPALYQGSIGMYAGSNISNYLLFNLYPALGYTGTLGNLQTLIGNDKDYLATHVSYKLNLRGPSVNVQTACSTSLVAVHLACQSLLNYECDMALAGGVAVRVPHKAGYFYQDGGIFSPDGHCRPFDARAQGTIFGNGLGVVVLKRLKDAMADGDRIDAIIRGSAINNDGSLKIGYAAPGEDGQAEVIAEALAMAQADPQTITYIETHGTGTPLGDPIEIAALTRVFRSRTQARGFCALGAVKSNLGHLESAAGIAGLIKTVLALKHKQIPPSLHFEQPNPQIDFGSSPFYINTRLIDWPVGRTPRRAGVSSFGIGGTNAHVVLEEAPTLPTPETQDGCRAYLLPLSARTPAALHDLIRAYRNFLADDENGTTLPLQDIVYTASLRRRHHCCRIAAAGHSHKELIERLDALLNSESGVNTSPSSCPGTAERRKLAFVFSGQGSQWLGMGRQLLDQEPVFREMMERCSRAMQPYLDWPLLSAFTTDEAQSRLNQIDVIQPVLFALQVSLATLWRSWGIEPDALVGHSMGEVAAAHVAGVLSLEDTAQIICRRSKLLTHVSGRGAMAVVGLTVEQARAALVGYEDRLSVAVSNSPKSTVLSGEPAALKDVLATLERQGTFCRWINVDVASHSPQMDLLCADLLQILRGLEPQPASIHMVSTVTGQAINGSELDAAYWARNLREPVLFLAAVRQLFESGHSIFVEISPHPILLPAIEDSLYHLSLPGAVVASLRREAEEQMAMLESLGLLYALGQSVDWGKLYLSGGRCVRLPAYPWQRQRYWLEPTSRARLSVGTDVPVDTAQRSHPLLGRRLRSALKEIQFETALSLTRMPYLNDHCVCGQAVLPATAYLEMALAAATAVYGPGPHVLEQVSLHERLILEEAAQTMQLILTPAGPNGGAFRSLSQGAEAEPWRLHASGNIRVSQTETASANGDDGTATALTREISLATARARCTEAVPGEAYYERLRERGLEYGPGFQAIAQVWRGDGAALGLVHLPDALAAETDGYTIHPALLDAGLQLFGAVIPSDTGTDTYLPINVEAFQVLTSPGDRVWSYATLRSDDGVQHTALTGDVYLFGEDGRLVASVTGLCVKRMNQAMLRRAVPERVAEWLYQLQWQPQRRTYAPSQRQRHDTRHWLILSDRRGTGQSLARLFEERGEPSTLAFTGQPHEVVADGSFIDPARPEDLERILKSATYRGIIYLWGLEAAPPAQTTAASLQRDQARICGGVLSLIQALARLKQPVAPRLWLVSRGAQAVNAQSAPLASAQAPLWGLGRVIALEHPELHCVRVDLDPDARVDETRDLLEEIDSQDEEDQVAFRRGVRYLPRLVRATASASAAEPGLQIPENQPFRLAIPVRGVIDNLVCEPTTRRAPDPGEVELRVHAMGLNFRDVLNVLGMYPGDAGPLGLECAGTIVAVGADVHGLQAGDDVVAFAAGAFRSFATVSAAFVALKPGWLSFEEAATIPVAYTTACYGLHHLAKMAAGDRVLIHAAAGGVGLAAVQLARRAGAEVFATAGSPEKRAFLRSLGVQHVMNSRSLDFADEIMEHTRGQGVDIVLNSLAGEYIPRSLSILHTNGRFVEIGKRDIWDASQVAQARPDVAYFVFDLSQEGMDHPVLIGGLLRELMESLGEGSLEPLPRRVFPIRDAVSAFRTMAQAKHIGKIVLTHEQQLHAASFDGFCSDKTYLITGGLGDLGLLVARWMVDQGARHLALIGRSGASTRAHEAICEMEQAGTQVVVLQCDVAQEDQVARALAAIDQTMPPLRGIIHAAGVLDDGVLLRQDWERFASVFAAKVQGAWNLHTLTLTRPLDLFVLFSSTASLLGTPGQGNYAAANAFLDALAHERRAQGLPAQAINWGGWAEIGLAARRNMAKRMAAQGIEAIAPLQGLQALEQVLRQNMAQVAVLPINWQQLMEQFALGGEPPVLAEVVREGRSRMSGRTTSAARSELLRRLSEAPPNNRQHMLEMYLCEQARKVLGLTPSVALDPQQPLNALGLDSLMAIELRNALGLALERTLPATLLFDHPTIASLAGYLAQEVFHLTTGAQARGPASSADRADDVLSATKQLSADEVEALLAEELAALKELVDGE